MNNVVSIILRDGPYLVNFISKILKTTEVKNISASSIASCLHTLLALLSFYEQFVVDGCNLTLNLITSAITHDVDVEKLLFSIVHNILIILQIMSSSNSH
jgi:hypothetical protein